MRKQLVFCQDCRTCIGEHVPFFAQEHLKEFPTHKRYFVKWIVDPFSLPDFDAYMDKLRHNHGNFNTDFQHGEN